MSLRRRAFLQGGGLALGTLAAQGCAVAGSAAPAATARVPVGTGSGSQIASFGWEVCNLNGNGANIYVKIENNMVLQTVNADVSASITSAKSTGFAEVLCQGGVSRQAVPSFSAASQAYLDLPLSPNFGSVTPENPNNLSVVVGGMVQDQFLSVILKTWVPPDGSGCATARQAIVYPGLSLSAGDYLVFHMDHFGVGVDAEMQLVLAYMLV